MRHKPKKPGRNHSATVARRILYQWQKKMLGVRKPVGPVERMLGYTGGLLKAIR
jgi:hypothetical protein